MLFHYQGVFLFIYLSIDFAHAHVQPYLRRIDIANDEVGGGS